LFVYTYLYETESLSATISKPSTVLTGSFNRLKHSDESSLAQLRQYYCDWLVGTRNL